VTIWASSLLSLYRRRFNASQLLNVKNVLAFDSSQQPPVEAMLNKRPAVRVDPTMHTLWNVQLLVKNISTQFGHISEGHVQYTLPLSNTPSS
jgi:hypothetical protein